MAELKSTADYNKMKEFADLIEETIKSLKGVFMPAQLSAALEERLAAWEKADKDFAAVLKELKGQAWSLQADHLRAVRDKLVIHLEKNLKDVKKLTRQ